MSKSNFDNLKKVKIAYILNLILPGIGNIYFGQKWIGVLIFMMFLLAIFLLFTTGSTTIIGIGVIILSIIIAIPTAGLALLIGLPIGFLILFLGASSIFIWLLCLLSSLFMVYRKENLIGRGEHHVK